MRKSTDKLWESTSEVSNSKKCRKNGKSLMVMMKKKLLPRKNDQEQKKLTKAICCGGLLHVALFELIVMDNLQYTLTEFA